MIIKKGAWSFFLHVKKLSVSIINHDFSCNKTMLHYSYANIKQFANYLTSTPQKFVPVPAMELFSLWPHSQVNWTAKTLCVAIKSAIYEWHMDRASNNKQSVIPRRTILWRTPPPVCSYMSCLLQRIKHKLHAHVRISFLLFWQTQNLKTGFFSLSFIMAPPLIWSFERL